MPRMVSKPSGSQPQSNGSRRHPSVSDTPTNVAQSRPSAATGGQSDPSSHPRSSGHPSRRSASSSAESSSARAGGGGAMAVASGGGAAGAPSASRTLPALSKQQAQLHHQQKQQQKQQQHPSRSSKGTASAPSKAHSLPVHGSAVPARGAAAEGGSRRPHSHREPSSHRGNPHGSSALSQPSSTRPARSNSNLMNMRVEVNQDRQKAPTRERRPGPSSTSASIATEATRQSQSLPGHGSLQQASASLSPPTSANDSQHTHGPRKSSTSSKDPKERYMRQMQMKQAATLPAGSSVSRVPAVGNSSSSSGQTRPRPGVEAASPIAQAQTRTSSNNTFSAQSASAHPRPSGASVSHHAQQMQSSSSRDNNKQGANKSTVSSSTPNQQDQRRDRSQDIARITVDARSVINRAANSSNNNQEMSPATGTASSNQQAQAVPVHSQVFRTTNRNLALPTPSPLSSAQDRSNREPDQNRNATTNSGRNEERSRTVDPSSLRLDIVNLTQQDQGASNHHHPSPNSAHIFTNNLNAGVSVNRPERPEVNEALPDILNSHVLPPYTVRQNQHRPSRQNNHRSRSNQSRGGRRQSRNNPGVTQIDDEEKGCCTHESCLSCLTVLTTFRWVLVSLALLGVICVITGIILGALHMTVGSSYLTLSLMFIGLGVMLVIVVGVGWKCTPPGHEPCHLLFNLGEHCTRDVSSSSSRRRHRERNHWYGGVSYPEFRYRRPPPSYNASMQEYQQQLMLAQFQMNNGQPNNNNMDGPPGLCPADLPPSYDLDDNYSLPSSPPPSYKSRASTIRPGLHITFPPQGDDYPSSRPPTYRSRAGTGHRPALENMRNDENMGGIDNPACSDTEPLSSSSGDSSRRQSDATTSESAGSSTLRRVDQVVGYLDNVLEGHDRTLEYNIHPAPPPTRNTEGAADTLASETTKAVGASGTSNAAPSEDSNRIRDTPL